MNVLLDYFFPITSITPTPAASTAFLKQVCVIVSPSPGSAGVLYECSTDAEIEAVTSNDDAKQLLAAGMSKVFLLPMDDLDLATVLATNASEFFTVLISSDFDKDDITEAQATGVITISSYANLVSGTDDVITINGTAFTAQVGAATLGTATFQAATSNDATATSLAAQINAHATIGALVEATVVNAVVTLTAIDAGWDGNDITLTYTDNDTNVGAVLSGLSAGKLTGGAGLFLGSFKGVAGVASDDSAFLAEQAVIERRCAFYADAGLDNMFWAFGKMLSNPSNWLNQQYISMPISDDIENLGDAESYFDDRISFVITDSEFGKRLALFACGGQAIVAPYIKRNLEIDMQSAALSYVSGNMPAYTKVQAALIEDELDKVMKSYIADQMIEDGTVEVLLEEENFVATGNINIAEPKALWRIFGEIRQTL